MKRIALALALLLVSVAAFADFEGAVSPGSVAPRSALIGCINNTVAPVVGDGQQVAVHCDTSGRVITVGTATGGTNSVTGPTGNNADSVAPTATGQVPTDAYTYGFDGANWQRLRTVAADASIPLAVRPCSGGSCVSIINNQFDGQGASNTSTVDASFNYVFNGTTWDRLSSGGTGSDGLTAGALGVVSTGAFNYGFNGTTWDRLRTLGTASNGILAVGINPTSAAQGSIVPVATATAGSQSLVLKGSAGNLYTITADNASQNLSGKLIIVNSATVPPVGTLTSGLILDCVGIATGGGQGANVTKSYNPGPMPRYGTGIVALFSTAQNCGTWTPGGMSGYISGLVQ